MTTATMTSDQDSIVCEIEIAAPPEKVFQALIDPKQVMQWWTSDQCQIESFALDARRGGRWAYNTKQSALNISGVSRFHCEGEVLEYDPPRLLAYTWVANWHDDRAQRTVVRWELVKSDGGTYLKVTHSGLANLPTARKDYSGGWPGVVEQLRTFAESHSVGPMRFVSNANFAIHVTDLSRARTFYRDQLGFHLIMDSPEKLAFETGRFTLYVNRDDHDMPFIPALEVKDYEEAKEFLQSSGCEIIREWPKSKALYFKDPLGQVFDIIEVK